MATTSSHSSQIKLLLSCVVVVAIYFGVTALPIPYFLPKAQSALAVFCIAAFLWITNVIPLAITGIVVLFLLPLTGAATAAHTYQYFGNSAVFFVLGAFILASPVMRSGLSTRVALTLISKFGRGPVSLLLSVFVLSSGLAFIISEHAVAAMLFPIMIEILKATKVSSNSRFGLGLMLAMGWGTAIGGTATLLGGARAPLALGVLHSITGETMSFLDWMHYALPVTLAMLICAFITIFFIARKSSVNIAQARAQLELHHSSLGKLSSREIITCLILLVTVTLWISCGTLFGLDRIAFLGVILAFLFRVTTWREVEEDVQWSIFIVYGSAIALSGVLQETGAAKDIVHLVLDTGLNSPFLVFAVLILLAYFLTEAMSNAATVAVLIPIALALAQQYHIDTIAMTVALATAAGLTFLLPVSTPAIAIISSSVYSPPQKVFSKGLIIKLLGVVVLFVMFEGVWPAIGIPLFLH